MAKTIAEKLQIIKNSTEDIKQAIIDKGGEISGNITTWADVINGLNSGGSELKKFTVAHTEFFFENDMTWGDFVNSIYNIKHFIPYLYVSDKFIISGNNVYDGLGATPISLSIDTCVPVLVTDKIIPNKLYFSLAVGGGADS